MRNPGGCEERSITRAWFTSVAFAVAALITASIPFGAQAIAGIVICTGACDPPTVSSASPSAGPVSGGTKVQVTGSAFVAGQTAVTFGGKPATSVDVKSESQLDAVAPQGVRGAVTIEVTTSNGTASLVGGYRYYLNPATGLGLTFEGNAIADIAVYRPSTGEWFILPSAGDFDPAKQRSLKFGDPAKGDVPLRGDFDGDGKRDVAVYRPSTGTWFWLKSLSNDTQYEFKGWGMEAQGDVPVPGDYDGDGKTDPTVYRAKYGTWFILRSSTGYSQYWAFGWGAAGDQPMPGDYDGDGRSDIAVYRPSTGEWFVLPSSTDFTTGLPSVVWGDLAKGDVPVPGDYDGDGKLDFAVYRPSTGTWFWLKSSTNNAEYGLDCWGAPGYDVPVPADYDGDGRWDPTVYAPANGTWLVLRSSEGYTMFSAHGLGGQLGDIALSGRQ